MTSPISIHPQEGERLLRLLQTIDERTKQEVGLLTGRVASLEENTRSHAIAAQEFRLLAHDVRQVLVRDVDHEQRIGGLEKLATDAGKSAGGKSGLTLGALGSAIVVIIAALAEMLK